MRDVFAIADAVLAGPGEVRMPKMQREKGKRWEREVAAMFRDAMPGAEVKRGWQARSGGPVEASPCSRRGSRCAIITAPPSANRGRGS